VRAGIAGPFARLGSGGGLDANRRARRDDQSEADGFEGDNFDGCRGLLLSLNRDAVTAIRQRERETPVAIGMLDQSQPAAFDDHASCGRSAAG
jgi:hypothetical protein